MRLATISGVVGMEKNRIYFERRAEEERTAASRAIDIQAREAHEKMAERYQQLVDSVEDAERSPVA
ncbi:MAG TPA: hypothetical protein VFK19_06965 [Sphingomicrobium sp.]|nr:hypothetical protein [Sphingomicrobium sp.]